MLNDRFSSLTGFDGIPNTYESFLLLSRYNGDLQEGVVELIDLTNFKIMHSWNPDFDALNRSVKKVGEFEYLERDGNNNRQTLQHPKLLKDGNLLFNSIVLRKIDACSEIVFQKTHDMSHHSVETDIDGNIWVPSHLYPQTLPEEKVGRGSPTREGSFIEDGIVMLSPQGEILYEKSISQILIDNGLEYLLFSVGDKVFEVDPTHLNDIQPVNYDGHFWKKGDVFLSLRHQSMVLLYRPSTNQIIWKGTGPFFHQHDVDILDEHRISIFNNNSKNLISGDVVDGNNEVLIYDFKSNKYSSYLKDDLIKHDVRTTTEGLSQILPNGDLFIEESNHSRTLYFNADGSLRWTHINRAEDGNLYRIGWSRILYTNEDLSIVKEFLQSKELCNE